MWAWALLPVFLASGGIVGTWSVCAIAASNNSVNLTVKIPFISECAAYPPQSGLFSLICAMWTGLILLVVVIRYQQARDLGDHCYRANLAAMILGFIAASGVALLGSFPLKASVGVHLFGAYLAFFVGLSYFWLQLWLTSCVEPSQDRHWLIPCRAALCSLCSLFLLAMFLLKALGFRSMAVTSEWAMVMVFFLLFGSFAAEFRHIDYLQLTVQKKRVRSEEEDGESMMPMVS